MRRAKRKYTPTVVLEPSDIEFILDGWHRGYEASHIVDLMAERGVDISERKVWTEVRKARPDPRAEQRRFHTNANLVRAS